MNVINPLNMSKFRGIRFILTIYFIITIQVLSIGNKALANTTKNDEDTNEAINKIDALLGKAGGLTNSYQVSSRNKSFDCASVRKYRQENYSDSYSLSNKEILLKLGAEAVNSGKLPSYKIKDPLFFNYYQNLMSPPFSEVKSPNLEEKAVLAEVLKYSRPFIPVDDFTGWLKAYHPNKKLKMLTQFIEGKANGISVYWYDSGIKSAKVEMKNNRPNGLALGWHKNGTKAMEGSMQNGFSDGVSTMWYPNGQKSSEFYHFKNKTLNVQVWMPNGQKCPVSSVKNGNGVFINYDLNGNEVKRVICRDGEELND